jgi:hypothetical protein
MSQPPKKISIGNAGGYWGDDPKALLRQIEGERLDYITMDFLAEITMSILQKQKNRDPAAGYARDFLGMLTDVLGRLIERKTCIITNAGGVNPEGCAEAILTLAKQMGLNINIGVVKGDDILSDIDRMRAQGHEFQNMETGEDFAGVAAQIQAANIYFGAMPVVEVLKDKPDMVITGRVTDTGITLAPMIHTFGWKLDDWDKLASGIVAGHLLECGSQSTGGNFTDWKKIQHWDQMGYPIVDVSEDGSFVMTKHEKTGGMVTVDTCREQLFYEMGHPKVYLTPDVVADFSTINLKQVGEDKVQISGVKGFEPTPFYKVSMAYEDGLKAQGTILISGPEAASKAKLFADIFWRRCAEFDLIEQHTEYVGWNACHRSLGHEQDGNEIILKLSARGNDARSMRDFAKLVPSLILSGPPGVAVLGGVPKVQDVISYWPALISKKAAHPIVKNISNDGHSKEVQISSLEGNFEADEKYDSVQEATESSQSIEETLSSQFSPRAVPLKAIALARSGDKGDTCNIGVMARSPQAFEFLREYLTAQRMKNLFQELCYGKVTRYELENLQGFNFLLESSLGGGGTKTLRSDAQGKTFGQALLRQSVEIPGDVLASVKGTN